MSKRQKFLSSLKEAVFATNKDDEDTRSSTKRRAAHPSSKSPLAERDLQMQDSNGSLSISTGPSSPPPEITSPCPEFHGSELMDYANFCENLENFKPGSRQEHETVQQESIDKNVTAPIVSSTPLVQKDHHNKISKKKGSVIENAPPISTKLDNQCSALNSISSTSHSAVISVDSGISIQDTPKTSMVKNARRTLFLDNVMSNESIADSIIIPLESSGEDMDYFSKIPINIEFDDNLEADLQYENLSEVEDAQKEETETEDCPEGGDADKGDADKENEELNAENVEGQAESDEESTPSRKNTRKRKKNPGKWKSNVAKAQLARGEEHISPKGAHRRGRAMKEGCDEECKFKCKEHISEEARTMIFQQFWSIESQKEKWDFIARCVEVTSIEGKSKKTSRKYFFKAHGLKIRVCKTMFLQTLDVCDSLIQTTVKKMGEDFCISPDKRKGGHPSKAPVKVEDIRQTIRNHIAGLPRLPSHYSRETSSKEYLIERFQYVSDMHEDYADWMKANHPEKKVATVRQYRDVFNHEYNIGFFLSKKDLCDECVSWDNTPEEARGPLEEAHKIHIENKELAIALKRADSGFARRKEFKKTLVVAHFDFEKNLICPKSNSGVFYYKRKLNVSNFTISDVGNSDDFCYVYDETVAGKGSNEVASFLHNFIELKVCEGIKEFRFYSDNCFGQNKNRNVAASYLFAGAKFNVDITHTFLEKGHTYNAADTLHSLVERKTKRKQIFAPGQWCDIIANAKKSNHPVKLVKVEQDLIYDWNDLTNKLNLNKDENGTSIPWKSVRRIKVEGHSHHVMKFKVHLKDQYRTVSTKGVGRPVNFITYELQQALHGPRPISQAKHKDLIYYCDKRSIPEEFHDFYRNLVSSANVADEEVEESEPVGQGRPRKRRQAANPKPKGNGKKRNRGKVSKSKNKVIRDEDDSENQEEILSD